ncbi:MAG: hypothetical protein ACRC3B_21215 [Bacteroidia bacterium]
MRALIFICLCFLFSNLHAQTGKSEQQVGNIRLSFLIFPPFTPLLTLEMRTFENLTIQLETNFINTHGVNLKYFVKERMNGHFVFVGTAFIENSFLRKDENLTLLPYAGYGYAYRFGKSNAWTFDNRLGIGQTINADKNAIYPVLKTGIGRTF